MGCHAAVDAAPRSPNRRSSASGIENSVKPQSRQTTIGENTITAGLSRFEPGKWIMISESNCARLFDAQDLQDITHIHFWGSRSAVRSTDWPIFGRHVQRRTRRSCGESSRRANRTRWENSSRRSAHMGPNPKRCAEAQPSQSCKRQRNRRSVSSRR
jgi:hypothetical protein